MHATCASFTEALGWQGHPYACRGRNSAQCASDDLGRGSDGGCASLRRSISARRRSISARRLPPISPTKSSSPLGSRLRPRAISPRPSRARARTSPRRPRANRSAIMKRRSRRKFRRKRPTPILRGLPQRAKRLRMRLTIRSRRTAPRRRPAALLGMTSRRRRRAANSSTTAT